MKTTSHAVYDLHPASVVGSLFAGPLAAGPAKRDATPEAAPARRRARGRLFAALRRREAAPVPAPGA